jgi:autotransporter-associated beta strand protein
MITTSSPVPHVNRRISLIAAACLLGLVPAIAPHASAQTTISGTVTVTDPATYFGSAGTITIPSGSTLQINPGANGTYNISNPFVLSGGAGTVGLKVNRNDTIYNFTGPFSSTATGAQTLALFTGYAGNGDREEMMLDTAIPNASGGSPLAVSVTFRTQTASFSYVSLKGSNTFTGDITLSQTGSAHTSYLTVGGRGYKLTNTSAGFTSGTGGLAPNYPGNVVLGTGTNFVYASSAALNMTGQISGAGAMRALGTGTLTLSGTNTYSGNTTVDTGASLILGTTGSLRFTLTNTTSNKVTGAGSATFNGTFTLDTSAVTNTSGSWPLVDTTTKNFDGSFALDGFSGPVGDIYTRNIAGQTWTFIKSTGILSLSSNALITALGIPGSAGVINQTSKTIDLTVPYTPWGTSGLATLAPTFTLTTGTSNQNSGAPPSPTFAVANPATYTVTDGDTVNNYAVTVTVSPPSTASAMLTCTFGALGAAAIDEASGTVRITVPPDQAVTSLAPTFTLSANATINPASGSTQNFTNPVVYRVTAENGTTFKDYTVIVESYNTWAHSGSLFIDTTPNGANVSGSVTNFPLLVRFNAGNFNFAQAQSDGRDIRFTTAAGAALPYQIEQWDSVNQRAAVWVKIPTITGNSTQEIKMYWGKSGVVSLSSGSEVFNSSNGYASVIHMGDTLTDVIGTTTPSNVNTTATNGLIGRARSFASGQGIQCGTSITGLPTGNGPFSTGVWFRSTTTGTSILGWGLQQASQRKVVMEFKGPPSINMDCWFGGANITSTSNIPASEWTYVVHTFQTTGTRLYINGALNASNSGGTMQLQNTGRYDIGGWSGTFNFVGQIDEARISNVVRSADWVKLEYENQKPLQTLVGGLVSPGSDFSVTPSSVTINEAATTTLTAQAGGAQKVYWSYIKDAQETLIATDQLTLDFTAGRVPADDSATIRFKAVFSSGVQTIDVPLTVLNTVPDPVFTLVPSTTTWDGRQTMTVTADITNLAAMQDAGFGSLNAKWSVGGVAVTKQESTTTLTLTRSQGSGPMTVTLTLDNWGAPVTRTITIDVQEPASDPWLERVPGATEKPVNKQFFARNPETNMGTIFYNGTQGGTPDEVFLKVYQTPSGGSEALYATHRQALVGGAYAFTAPIPAGLFTYRVVYGTTTGGSDTNVATVTDLVCGDAFIIQGQSNALATDNSAPNDTATTNPWIRTYGLTSGWGYAISKGNDLQLGLWGWFLANRLVTNNSMPICIINGAVGGTRIDQHRPNPAGPGTAGSLYSIYANAYNRVTNARLNHGIRGLFWHQGEQNQGSGGIDPDYDYKFYTQYFVDISAAWKRDFPNLRNYYLFQIWPAACGDQSRNDQLREVQRKLPRLYSNMKIMSTHGIVPGSSCHYEPAGYQKFSDLIGPLVEEDVYGYVPPAPNTAPNLRQAYFTTSSRNEIALVFDQNVAWNPGAPTMLFLANAAGATSGSVTSGSATGNTIKLQVSGASSAAAITYLKGLVSWNQANILYGTNGIAALTFADVAIGPAAPAGLSATGGTGQISLTWSAVTGATTYKVKRSTTNGGPYTTIASTGTTAFTDLSVTAGTPYFYVVSAVNTVGDSSGESPDSNQATATPIGGYAAWSGGVPIDGDSNNDGVKNGVAWALGAADPNENAIGLLPVLDNSDATYLIFTFNRSTAANNDPNAQIIVQYGDDLSGWPPAIDDGDNIIITETPGNPTAAVEVKLKRATLAPEGVIFLRLKVSTQSP